MAEAITPTIEDYLGLIYLLEREGQTVIGARLAKRLGVSRPTVTMTLQRMVRAGLVRLNERKEVSLTPAGLEAAENLLRRHMLAEWLLRDLVGLPWHQVHEEADRLEHHFSEQAVERLETLFQREACPHGNPMPGIAASEAIPLLEASVGEEVCIVRVVEEAEEKRELMAFLEENGLLPGARLRVSSLQPYNETMTVEVAGRPVVLGLAVARFIQVRHA
ncbi:MAG: metal-dependent transcriptional regulator [Candidatus Micrarchaeaceae archaeon]